MIALHGKGQDAAGVMAGGVEQGLAQAVAAGIPPFAVVAVDGGGGYWHKRASGEDAGAMVLNELIPMLGEQGLDTSRVGFLGWSMGGYGALLLGARLGPARTAAICAVSPALWTSSGATAPGAFDGADDYAANSVWGLPALGSIPIRIDCGNSDPFYSATKQFIAQLPNTAVGRILPGRARRRVLELAAARARSPGWRRLRSRLSPAPRTELIRPSAAASPMSLRKWLPGKRIDLISAYAASRAAARSAPVPTTDSTRPPEDTIAPSSRRVVPACSTPSASAPTITSPTRGRPG